MTISLNVAIVGAGPGGLGLANILHQISKSLPSPEQLSFKVFELDPSKDFRPQGGMLDIHRSSGQQALKRGGAIEAFKKHMRIDATELFIRDNNGVAHLRHSEEEEGGLGEEGEVSNIERPEIDRLTLRRILLEGLPEQSVEWAKKLASITKSESSGASGFQFELHFADGSSAKGFDLVIGADGTWSKVRSGTEALMGVKPSIPPYSGLICIDTLISDAQKRHPELVEFNGKGSCFAVSRNTSLASQLNGDGSLRVYYFLNAKEDWKIEGQPGKRRADRLIPKGPFVDECLSEWCQTSKELVIQSDTDELLVRPLYEYPPGYSWKSPIPGITLLGDAAHVMTPFSGIGVNLALADALDLSAAIEEIIAGSKPVGEALDAFEAKMYKRSSEGCAQTYYNRTLFMGKPGPDGTVVENEGVEKVVEIFTGQAYTKPEFN